MAAKAATAVAHTRTKIQTFFVKGRATARTSSDYIRQHPSEEIFYWPASLGILVAIFRPLSPDTYLATPR